MFKVILCKEMKKIFQKLKYLIILLILFLLNKPAFSIEDKSIRVENKINKESINLKILDEQSIENEYIKVIKTKYNFKYSHRFGVAYIYTIENKTDDDIILSGVVSDKYFNKDISGNRIKPFKYLFITQFSTGQNFIPYYGIYYKIRIKLELKKFMRDFPQELDIAPYENVLIYVCSSHKVENPKAKFIFEINDDDFELEF